VLAAYLWLAFTPLIVGIDRGVLLPLLRPNEALLLGLLSALAVRWLVLAVLRRARRPRFPALDGWFAVLALTGSALPLLWTVAQGRSLGLDEFLSAANVAKYYLVFVMVRAAVVSEEQVRRCLWVAMSVGAVVGVIAFLQSMRLFGVPELLATYWAPFGQTQALSRGRGTATIGVAAGTADVMVFCIAIAIGLLLRDPSDRPPAIQPRRPQRLAAELGGAGTT
jgi:hypothetical protein